MLREVSRAVSRSRRDFLRVATGATLGGALRLRAAASPGAKKAIVVTFGGGARDDETFAPDRKSTRLNSSHSQISYAVFCLKKKKNIHNTYKLHIEYIRVTYYTSLTP